jgi:hypothetical protein
MLVLDVEPTCVRLEVRSQQGVLVLRTLTVQRLFAFPGTCRCRQVLVGCVAVAIDGVTHSLRGALGLNAYRVVITLVERCQGVAAGCCRAVCCSATV